MSCGVGQRCGSDPALLWLWHRPEATVLIRPLAWGLPYALGVAPERKKERKKERKRKIHTNITDKHKYKSPQSSRCGAMGLVVSGEQWDTGSTPGLAQWIKDPALLQLWLRSQKWLSSDSWPRNYICYRVAKKMEKLN